MRLDSFGTLKLLRVGTWMLVLCFLAWLLIPSHYHLHHDADDAYGTAPHFSHVLDQHILFSADHHDHHDVGHVIEAVADITLKNTGQLSPVFIALSLLLVLLSLTARGACPPVFEPVGRPSRLKRHSIPPLRAPPRD